MRSKKFILNHLPLNTSLPPGTNFISLPSSCSPCRMIENKGYGQLIMLSLWLLLLLRWEDINTFLLLQHGASFMGSQVLPGACSSADNSLLQVCIHLLWHGGSPMDHRSLSIPSTSHLFPWAAGRKSASPWSSPQAAGEIVLQCLQDLPPTHFHSPWCVQLFFFHIFVPLPSCSLYSRISPLLKYVIPMMLLPLISDRFVLEPAGHWLYLAQEKLPPASHRSQPVVLYQILAMQTQYTSSVALKQKNY